MEDKDRDSSRSREKDVKESHSRDRRESGRRSSERDYYRDRERNGRESDHHDRERPKDNDKQDFRRLYVTNIGYRIREKELYDAFKRFGKILECKIIVDHGTGASRGYGFVTFEHPEDGRAARDELDGKLELDSRKIVVQVATGRERESGSARPRHVDDLDSRSSSSRDLPPERSRDYRDHYDDYRRGSRYGHYPPPPFTVPIPPDFLHMFPPPPPPPYREDRYRWPPRDGRDPLDYPPPPPQYRREFEKDPYYMRGYPDDYYRSFPPPPPPPPRRESDRRDRDRDRDYRSSSSSSSSSRARDGMDRDSRDDHKRIRDDKRDDRVDSRDKRRRSR